MRQIRLTISVGDPKWDYWRQISDRGTSAALDDFRNFQDEGSEHRFRCDVNEYTYKKSRPLLIPAFNGHCAYCESDYRPVMAQPEVEHFRPKGAIKTYAYKEKAAMAALGGNPFSDWLSRFEDIATEDHTGYFWLAYRIENLLLACNACNKKKQHLFPVVGTRRLQCSECLDPLVHGPLVEVPMLVNPYVDDPNQHFAFDNVNGFVRPLSVRGAISIDVYDLNRDGLKEARKAAIRHAKLEFNAWYNAFARGDDAEAIDHQEILDKYEAGEYPYSTAALTHIGLRQELHSARGIPFGRKRGIWPSQLVLTIPPSMDPNLAAAAQKRTASSQSEDVKTAPSPQPVRRGVRR